MAQGDVARAAAEKTPPPVTAALLGARARTFGIYCSPCHGLAGDGDGIIVAHGFPAPPSYHIDRLLAAPAQHFYDVITDGYGVMYSYADRVDPHDRWAIAAYIRALQLSRRATVAQVPDAAERTSDDAHATTARRICSPAPPLPRPWLMIAALINPKAAARRLARRIYVLGADSGRQPDAHDDPSPDWRDAGATSSRP